MKSTCFALGVLASSLLSPLGASAQNQPPPGSSPQQPPPQQQPYPQQPYPQQPYPQAPGPQAPGPQGTAPQAPPPGAPPPGYGQPAQYPPLYGQAPAPAEVHPERGFFLSAGLGGGYLNVSGNSRSLSEAGTLLNLTAGMALDSKLVLFGKLIGLTVKDPEVKMDGGPSIQTTETEVNMSALGAGASLFLNPNLYVSGSLLLAQLNSEVITGIDGDSGAGINLGAGYAWWLASSFGLGVGADLLLAKMDDSTGFGFAVALTGTYN